MANFKKVNQAVKAEFPNLDVKVVRGSGYVYFEGNDGFDKVDAIYANPVCISDDDLIRFCIENIKDSLKGL